MARNFTTIIFPIYVIFIKTLKYQQAKGSTPLIMKVVWLGVIIRANETEHNFCKESLIIASPRLL